MGAKKLEILRELVPDATTIALLVNPANPPGTTERADIEAAAHALGLQIQIVDASNDSDFETASTTLARQRPSAILIGSDPFFVNRREQLVALAARLRLPALYSLREFVLAGGLISYGTHLTDAYRQGGVYTGKILKGTKPAELPVMQPTAFDLVINLRTAKALGIKVPLDLQVAADEVIQ